MLEARWLADQFPTAHQLRMYLELTTEERVACFPGHGLEQLDDAQWLHLGRRALQLKEQLVM